MAAKNFQTCLQFTLGTEGGFTANPKDPGNWTGGKRGVGVLKGTKFGIAAASYPKLDIKNLTLETAGNIYRMDYWNKVNGDALASGVDLMMFDIGVNSGVSRARGWLKECLVTAPVAQIEYLHSRRMGFWQSLATWVTFGKGWKRRETDCRAAALKLVIR